MVRLIAVFVLLFPVACSYRSGGFRVDVMNPAAPLYDEGINAYRRGELERAIKAFKDIVEYYPTNDLADEALYMLANCYLEEGDYVNAYAYFKLYLARFPTGPKYDEVLKRVKELEKKLKEGDHGGSGDSDNSTGNR